MKQLTRQEIIVLLERLEEVNRSTESVFRRGTLEDDEKWANYYDGYADAARHILHCITDGSFGRAIYNIHTEEEE